MALQQISPIASKARRANPQLEEKIMSTSLAVLENEGFSGRRALADALSEGVNVTSIRDAIVRLSAKLCR